MPSGEEIKYKVSEIVKMQRFENSEFTNHEYFCANRRRIFLVCELPSSSLPEAIIVCCSVLIGIELWIITAYAL